jgi:agmatinase
VVQVDAHTDLLPHRLGVKYCYGTWSYHANDLLGRGGRLVQVGIRASGRDRSHWEGSLAVRQLWAAEVLADPSGALDAVVAAVRASGARAVYLSNDIDGTDESFADATGTPEPGGLPPDLVVELIRRLGREVGLAGGDVMEVAPAIARSPGGAGRTLAVAARYLRETAEAVLGRKI